FMASCGDDEPIEPIIPVESITISASNWDAMIGETTILTATIFPKDADNQSIEWTSSDENIATVDAVGKVTAIAIGKAVITATAGEKSAICVVTVNGNISLDNSALSIEWNKTATLTPSEKGGVWKSSNEFVATVEGGIVKALHEGTTTVTYTIENSSASCVVTVTTTNDYFTTITTWGASNAQIKEAVKSANPALELLLEKDGNLMYTLPGEAYPWYGFTFENDRLNGSTVYFTDQMFDDQDFNGFLAQRFKRIDETVEGVRYANANTLTEATLACVVSYDTEDDVYVASYVPVQHTKADSDMSAVKAAKALYKAAINK
ncbi:MAG: Ig-like domain-containing protein, partial [Muribaculaceae bacterium]|nr:Ig-like domain-containing protein [Muribaculaceae bacterium]